MWATIRVGFVVIVATVAYLGKGSTPAIANGSLTGTAEVSTGYSDNILNVAERRTGDSPVVQGGAFLNLAPGFLAVYQRPRATHNLLYTFRARLLLDHSSGSSYSNTLLYTSLYSLSVRTSLRLGASFNAGRVNGFDQVGIQGEIIPQGDVAFRSYAADAAIRHQVNADWATELSAVATTFVPTNVDTDSSVAAVVGSTDNLSARLRAERRYQYHLVGAEVESVFNQQQIEDTQKTLTIRPAMFWIWNSSERVSTNALAGVDIIGVFPEFEQGLILPRAAAAVTYSHSRGRATTGVSRGAVANLVGGNTTVNTQYFVNVGLPVSSFSRPTAVGLNFSYATGSIIDLSVDGGTRGGTKGLTASVDVQTELNRAWRLGFQAQTSRQQITDVTGMGSIDSDIQETRATVVLTGRYPETISGQIPPRSSDRAESSSLGFTQPGRIQAGTGAGSSQNTQPR